MTYLDEALRARLAELIEEIETVTFRETKWGRSGYNERDVDDFLDYLIDVVLSLLSMEHEGEPVVPAPESLVVADAEADAEGAPAQPAGEAVASEGLAAETGGGEVVEAEADSVAPSAGVAPEPIAQDAPLGADSGDAQEAVAVAVAEHDEVPATPSRDAAPEVASADEAAEEETDGGATQMWSPEDDDGSAARNGDVDTHDRTDEGEPEAPEVHVDSGEAQEPEPESEPEPVAHVAGDVDDDGPPSLSDVVVEPSAPPVVEPPPTVPPAAPPRIRVKTPPDATPDIEVPPEPSAEPEDASAGAREEDEADEASADEASTGDAAEVQEPPVSSGAVPPPPPWAGGDESMS